MKKTLFSMLLIAAITCSTLSVLLPTCKAASTAYNNLDWHDFDNIASSLKVTGTVVLYDGTYRTGNSITFTNQWVPSLGSYRRGPYPWDYWNDIVKSLTIDGSVILYVNDNYGGKSITFTSSGDPNENIGYIWNSNPNLVKAQGMWDCRYWHWDTSSLELDGGDSNNYVNWVSDGLVSSRSQDCMGDHWGVANFDQGYSANQEWINLADISMPLFGSWNNMIASLRVQGKVTLFDNTDFTGETLTLGPYQGKNGWIPNLATYGWAYRASSLHVEGTVTVYNAPNYVYDPEYYCYLQSFVKPTYQPNPLYIADLQTITLEGVVDDWYSDTVYTPWSWTGVKFDVWAVESLTSGKKIMMELYFLRAGGNLVWNPEWAKPPSGDFYNYLIAIDAFPQFYQRTIHPGDVARWKIDVKGCLTRGVQAYGLDINRFSIAQISFTVESGVNVSPETPACGCKLSKLRLGYTLTSSFKYHWGMVSGDTNGDDKIDMRDVVRVSRACGSVPGSANWDQMADLNLDGMVDGMDIAMTTSAYGSYAKVKQDYQATLYLIIPGNPPQIITIAVIRAKLFIMNNNKFFASVSLSQYTTTSEATTSFLVGYEGYEISGAQDGQAGSFQYGEGNVGGAFGDPSRQWYARGYNYRLTTPLSGTTYRFETWGKLTGSYTYTSLRLICTGYDMVQDFKDIHY